MQQHRRQADGGRAHWLVRSTACARVTAEASEPAPTAAQWLLGDRAEAHWSARRCRRPLRRVRDRRQCLRGTANASVCAAAVGRGGASAASRDASRGEGGGLVPHSRAGYRAVIAAKNGRDVGGDHDDRGVADGSLAEGCQMLMAPGQVVVSATRGGRLYGRVRRGVATGLFVADTRGARGSGAAREGQVVDAGESEHGVDTASESRLEHDFGDRAFGSLEGIPRILYRIRSTDRFLHVRIDEPRDLADEVARFELASATTCCSQLTARMQPNTIAPRSLLRHAVECSPRSGV